MAAAACLVEDILVGEMMDLSAFKALTFDCYGTLIDWESGILSALKPWLDRCRIMPSEDDLLAAFARHESRIQLERPVVLYRDVVARVLGAIAEDFGRSATDDEMTAFGGSIADWPPFPDSRNALAYFKGHYKLVAITNVDNLSFPHSSAKLGDPFDLVVTAEDVGSYKPAPAHFGRALAGLSKMGIAKHQVLHVAQSLFHDIPPAKALGLATCWVDRRAGRPGGATPDADAKPDLTVESLEELVALHRGGGDQNGR